MIKKFNEWILVQNAKPKRKAKKAETIMPIERKYLTLMRSPRRPLK